MGQNWCLHLVDHRYESVEPVQQLLVQNETLAIVE